MHLDDSDGLIVARWGVPIARTAGPGFPEPVLVHTAPRSTPMAGSDATGEDLVSNGRLGVDLIRVPAGGGFAPHTHPGDHILIVVAGAGTITVGGVIHPTEAGQVYMIEGEVPHAVGALTDHVILAVGAPHRAVDAPDRMTLVEYAAVTADLGDLTCLLCRRSGTVEALAADGCRHLPCRYTEV